MTPTGVQCDVGLQLFLHNTDLYKPARVSMEMCLVSIEITLSTGTEARSDPAPTFMKRDQNRGLG